MNPPPSSTPITYDQHAAFFGATGSGKTYRQTMMLYWRMRRLQEAQVSPTAYKIIQVDTKRAGPGYDERVGYFAPELRQFGGVLVDDYHKFRLTSPTDPAYHVYRPPREAQTPESFDAFFAYLMTQDVSNGRSRIQLPMLVIIDEYTDIFSGATSRTSYMPSFSKILQQGRSTMQTFWLASQKTSWIDSDIRANVTARFVFRMVDERDRERVAQMMGDKIVKQRIRAVHGFWFQNDLFEWSLSPIYFNGRA